MNILYGPQEKITATLAEDGIPSSAVLDPVEFIVPALTKALHLGSWETFQSLLGHRFIYFRSGRMVSLLAVSFPVHVAPPQVSR